MNGIISQIRSGPGSEQYKAEAADVMQEAFLPWDIIQWVRDVPGMAIQDERMQVIEVERLSDFKRRVTARTMTGTSVAFEYPVADVVPMRLWRPMRELHHSEWYKLKSPLGGVSDEQMV